MYGISDNHEKVVWLVDMGNEVWGVLFICVIYSIRLIKSFTPISYFLI